MFGILLLATILGTFGGILVALRMKKGGKR